MGAISAEFLKLRRSMSWAVVVILPLVLAATGTVNTLVNGGGLNDGWHTLWLRCVVFYGLFPLNIGIAILGSLVWRPEHRGSNWNALMSGPTSSRAIVVGKTSAVALLAISMQVVMVVGVVVIGKNVFGLPGSLPAEYDVASLLIALSSVPVAALQSGLSMLMRSFAAPIAVAFVGAGISAVLLAMDIGAVVFVSPWALVSRATQLGTGTFADSGEIGPATVMSVLVASAVLTIVITMLTTRVLEHSDAHT